MTRGRGGRRSAAVAVAFALVALPGCGGSDDDPPARTTGPGGTAAGGTTTAGSGGAASSGSTSATAASPAAGPSSATPDAAAYERAGGALCTAARDEAAALPRVQRDEGLSIAQAQERAAANGRRFNAAFADLRPPAALRGAHGRVLAFQRAFAASGSTTQVGRIVRLQQELARRYDAAGQTTCARLMRESTLGLREAEQRTGTTTTGP